MGGETFRELLLTCRGALLGNLLLLPEKNHSTFKITPSIFCITQQVVLGPNGVEEILPLGELNASEKEGLDKMSALLTKNIETGIAFANK